MHHCTDDEPVCRGCGLVLIGSPYWKGGSAYHPRTRERAQACHYGGWVCSEQCDRRATIEQEASMPGSGGCASLAPHMSRKIEAKWNPTP